MLSICAANLVLTGLVLLSMPRPSVGRGGGVVRENGDGRRMPKGWL